MLLGTLQQVGGTTQVSQGLFAYLDCAHTPVIHPRVVWIRAGWRMGRDEAGLWQKGLLRCMRPLGANTGQMI